MAWIYRKWAWTIYVKSLLSFLKIQHYSLEHWDSMLTLKKVWPMMRSRSYLLKLASKTSWIGSKEEMPPRKMKSLKMSSTLRWQRMVETWAQEKSNWSASVGQYYVKTRSFCSMKPLLTSTSLRSKKSRLSFLRSSSTALSSRLLIDSKPLLSQTRSSSWEKEKFLSSITHRSFSRMKRASSASWLEKCTKRNE